METLPHSFWGIKRTRSFLKFFACALALLWIAGPVRARTPSPGLDFSPNAAPDLVVTDIWNTGPLICYQILNSGDDSTKSAFAIELRIDGAPASANTVYELLDPGERYNQCLVNYAWGCGPSGDTVLVEADFTKQIDESNELNNTRSENWACDQTPPIIEEGPSVSDIKTTSAQITWKTNEDATSTVLYDEKLNTFGLSKSILQPVDQHEIDLVDLKPATLYQFKASSTDPSGNNVESDPQYFKTLPENDTEKPELSDSKIDRMPGELPRYKITTTAKDNDQIERVEFFLDDKQIGTDYSPAPADGTTFEWELLPGFIGMTQMEFYFEHTLRIDAYDRFAQVVSDTARYHPPEETLHGELSFYYPAPGYIYYISGMLVPSGTILPISVHASLYYNDCTWAHVPGPDGARIGCVEREEAVDSVEFYIDSTLVHTDYPLNDDDLTYDYDWNIGGLGAGAHTIVAISNVGEGHRSASRHISIQTGTANLNVERTLTQDGHMFQVDLRIENNGTVAANLNDLTDNLDGFQTVVKSSTLYTVTSHYDTSARRNTVNIDIHSLTGNSYTLNPDHHLDISYQAAPVLYREIDAPEYIVGDAPLNLTYNTLQTASFDLPATATSAGDSLLAAIWEIQLSDSNYLIVTNPCNLFAVNSSDSAVDSLLSGLADLSDAKQGALAYLVGSPSADTVDDAIETWGDFMKGSDGVAEHYLSNGYLLLVGELDIIPAHSKSMSPPWYVSWLDELTIDPTDLHYADTSSNLIDPELNIGRIIGNNATRLLIPVKTAAGLTRRTPGYDFDWSSALTVAGWPETRDGGSDHGDFWGLTDSIADRIEAHGTVVSMIDNRSTATRELARDLFFALAPGMDIIHWAGHGNWDVLDDLWASDFTAYDDPFGSSNPLIFATSCLTGDFTPGAGIAERTLQKGAAAYIGSTEVSYGTTNGNVARMFYDDWDPGEEIGPVFKSIKRDIGGFHYDNWATGYYEDIWTVEYHIFGDPELGAGTYPPAPEAAPGRIDGPLSSIQVIVPDIVLEKTDLGKDRAVIPGGSFVMMPDQPLVPSYSYVESIPSGTVIQNVALISRPQVNTLSGLDLDTFELLEDGPSQQPTVPFYSSEWFPAVNFDWGVVDNPDGSSELHIVIYPFFYNSQTQVADFYPIHNFEITTSATSVSIPVLDTDKPVYEPEETVFVDLAVTTTGAPQTVTLSAAVYALGSYELVDGLLLDTLPNLSGPATAALSWEIGKTDPGDYTVLAEVRSLAGDLLASASEPFSIGSRSGEASGLSAPDFFKIGDNLNLTFDFQNTGTLPITGTAMIRIEGLISGSLTEIQVPVDDLLPDASQHIAASWDSTGEQLEDFQVTAFVVYAGQTTPALTAIMETTWKLQLPLVRR